MSTSQSNVYGRLPGVRAQIVGGGLSNVQVGREQKTVIFGRGDPQDGEADVNDPTQVLTRVDSGTAFGRGTQLAEGVQKAIENKGNLEYIYGVMPEEIDVQAEPIAGGTGTLENAPIVEDTSYITVTNTTTAENTEEDVEWSFESPPPAPDASGVVTINPNSGEVESGDDDDYEIDYAYLDWESALDAADPVLNHSEVGVYVTLSDSPEVAEALDLKLNGTDDGEVTGLRREYKLAMGLSGAPPNMTTENGEGGIDVGEYSDSLDDDSMFLAGPVRRSDTNGRTVLAGIAGRMAGNALDNPIHGDSIIGYGRLTQSLSRDERDTLVEKNVIPIVDDYRDGEGGLTIEGNESTSSATDWSRTFQNRRVADLVLLVQQEIGKWAKDNLMRDSQLEEVNSRVIDEFETLARDGLIHGDPDGTDGGGSMNTNPAEGEEGDSQPYFVDVVRSDQETIAIASGFVPIGVTTGVDERITISDTVDSLSTTSGDSVGVSN